MKVKQRTISADSGSTSDSASTQESLPVKITLEGQTFEGQLLKQASTDISALHDIQDIYRDIRTIIHDINNHMTTILGNADLGLTQVEKHDDIYESISTIKTVGSKIQDLLRILSDTAQKIDQPKTTAIAPETHSRRQIQEGNNYSSSPVKQNRGRILVMDDKQEVRSVVGRILIRLGYEVDTAPDGVTTIQKYEQNFKSGSRYDAVIMDVNIPNGFGAEIAFKELFKIDPDVRAIVFSGCHNVGIMNNYNKFGFRGCVTKPFTVNELDAIVRQAILV